MVSSPECLRRSFCLDVPDAGKQAKSPFPADRDLHAEVENGNCTLKWTAAQSAVLHDVYLGTVTMDMYDIFDKLDASRVEQIVKLVAGDNFGQIFITDTNREHLDRILYKVGSDYKMFRVESGAINEMEEKER